MTRRRPARRLRRIATGLALVVILLPSSVFAHAIGVAVRVLDTKVEIEGYFEGDDPARDATVIVTNERNDVVAEGTLDGGGRWRFAKPPPGKYAVTVDAGPGHSAKRSFVVPGDPPDRAENSPTTKEAADVAPADSGTKRVWIQRIGLVCAALLVVALAGRLASRTN